MKFINWIFHYIVGKFIVDEEMNLLLSYLIERDYQHLESIEQEILVQLQIIDERTKEE